MVILSYRAEHLAEGVSLYLGDVRDVMPALASESVDMIWTDPPYGHSNHDGDFNSRLNEHRGIEDRPIANDTPELMREVIDFMLWQAARVLKADCCCCCCCCCCGGGPRPTFAWVAERMDNGGLVFFHSVIWDKLNPGLGWRYRRPTLRGAISNLGRKHGHKVERQRIDGLTCYRIVGKFHSPAMSET